VSQSDARSTLQHVHHVGLVTGQLERMRRFYTEVVGLQETRGFPEHRIAFLEAGGTLIELLGEDVPSAGTGSGGWHHLAWEVDDLDATFAQLVARGAAVSSPPEDFPQDAPAFRIAFLRDPDGNLLELVKRIGGQHTS
jgi:glyoxylase I family protein